MTRNRLHTIRPYKYDGMWVFDDPTVGLVRGPFVSGADQVIDRFMGDTPGALTGFNLTFSELPFPEHNAQFEWVRPEADGNWYRLEEPPMEGWLCPALLKYFDWPPARLYVKFG